MSQLINDTGTKAGIAGGILCTVAVNISNSDLVKTVLLAAMGSVVSVVVSIAVKQLLHRWRK